MKFTPNQGVNKIGDIIAANKRGIIAPSSKAATETRQALAAVSPRMRGKKIKLAN